MIDNDSLARARDHFVAVEGWPRHVANETALEFERLHRLRATALEVAPDEGSLLDRFGTRAGAVAIASSVDSQTSAARYRQVFGHQPPYPWRAGAAPADPNPAAG